MRMDDSGSGGAGGGCGVLWWRMVGSNGVPDGSIVAHGGETSMVGAIGIIIMGSGSRCGRYW